MVFGKYDSRVTVRDPGLIEYLNLSPRLVFLSGGRNASKLLSKSKTPIVERLINSIMRSGSSGKVKGKVFRDRFGCGKKLKAYHSVKKAFDIINKKTQKNPVEVLVRAIENSAPREETTRVKYGGITNHIGVDVSPQRRIDFALHNISLATIVACFGNKKTTADALSEELLSAAENDPKSLAVARKDEIERIARSAR